MTQLTAFGWSAVSLYIVCNALIIGRGFLLPLAVAFAITYLLIALSNGLMTLHVGRWRAPRWLARLVVLLAFIMVSHFLILMTAANVSQLVDEIPRYQQILTGKIEGIYQTLGIPVPKEYASLTERIDLVSLTTTVLRTVTEIASNAGMILIYILFLLLEAAFLHDKLQAIFPQQNRKDATVALLAKIGRRINSYLRIKTAVSFLTGACSYLILIAIGVDFPGFSALLIFFLNFIPTIGSIIATLFPCILAFVQFDAYTPLILTILLLGGLQFVIGNILEPRVMGRSFNLSGLVILLSLSIWGYIWGIVGMFLSVPIMVMISIVLANFSQTRWIAVLLSQDGDVD